MILGFQQTDMAINRDWIGHHAWSVQPYSSDTDIDRHVAHSSTVNVRIFDALEDFRNADLKCFGIRIGAHAKFVLVPFYKTSINGAFNKFDVCRSSRQEGVISLHRPN